MAFMGILLMWLAVILVVLGITTTISIISFILFLIMKKKKKKIKILFLVLAIMFIAPLVLTVGGIVVAIIASQVEKNASLTYNVMTANFVQAEKLLKKGVSPDCSIFSDEQAKDGELTILSCLCEYGFVEPAALKGEYGHISPNDTQNRDEILKMAQLLIKYGADVNYVNHEEGCENHTPREESDYYMSSDGCGRTPFLWAVYNNDLELAKLLVENGAKADAEDYTGYNAIEIIGDSRGGLAHTGTEMLEYVVSLGVTYDGKSTNLGQELEFLVMRNNEEDKEFDRFFEIIGFQSRY